MIRFGVLVGVANCLARNAIEVIANGRDENTLGTFDYHAIARPGLGIGALGELCTHYSQGSYQIVVFQCRRAQILDCIAAFSDGSVARPQGGIKRIGSGLRAVRQEFREPLGAGT